MRVTSFAPSHVFRAEQVSPKRLAVVVAPRPLGTDACCKADADAKADGAEGCGCS